MTPYLLLTLAALADVYTSHRAFKRGAVEINPLIAKLFGKRPSFGNMLLVKALAFGVIAYLGTDAMILAAAGVWGLVALLNLKH